MKCRVCRGPAVIDLPRPRDILSPEFNAQRIRCAESLNATRAKPAAATV